MKKKKKSFPKKPALILTAAKHSCWLEALSAVHAPHSLTTVRIIPHR